MMADFQIHKISWLCRNKKKKEKEEKKMKAKKNRNKKKNALARDGVRSPVIVRGQCRVPPTRCTRFIRPCDDRRAIVQ